MKKTKLERVKKKKNQRECRVMKWGLQKEKRRLQVRIIPSSVCVIICFYYFQNVNIYSSSPYLYR